MKLKIVDTGVASAQENMALDAQLLKSLRNHPQHPQPILHLYDWQVDSLTYGYFSDPSKFLNVLALEKRGIQMARRPTGGGISFHFTDFAFSLLIPGNHPKFSLNTLENYSFVNGIVASCIGQFLGENNSCFLENSKEIDGNRDKDRAENSFCMAKPTVYDVVIEGKKVGGAAQRRTKWGLLHQGTISLGIPSKELLQDIFLEGSPVVQSILEQSYPLLHHRQMDLKEARLIFKELLIALLTKEFDIQL